MPDSNAKQITRADGWFALYLLPDPPYYRIRRLVCWALGGNGEPEVVGLVASAAGSSIERAPTIEGFHQYIHADEITDAAKTTWEAIGEQQAQLAAGR